MLKKFIDKIYQQQIDSLRNKNKKFLIRSQQTEKLLKNEFLSTLRQLTKEINNIRDSLDKNTSKHIFKNYDDIVDSIKKKSDKIHRIRIVNNKDFPEIEYDKNLKR